MRGKETPLSKSLPLLLKDASFPLTLTLSLGEREQIGQCLTRSSGWCSACDLTAHHFRRQAAMNIPLPPSFCGHAQYWPGCVLCTASTRLAGALNGSNSGWVAVN
jgi:hypothetical protein